MTGLLQLNFLRFVFALLIIISQFELAFSCPSLNVHKHCCSNNISGHKNNLSGIDLTHESQEYQTLVDKLLDTWTMIDLIRASTGTDLVNKQIISEELVDQILSSYCITKRFSYDFNSEQKNYIIELLTNLEMAFVEVFDDVKLPETVTSCLVINRMKDSLELIN